MDELNARAQPEPEPQVRFEVSADADGGAVVWIRGELDISAVDALAEQVGAIVGDGPSRLVVDVGGLRFADSSAIALWVRWAGDVDEFELRRPSPLLLRVIRGMGLAEKLGVTR
jgi:anti-anti-sigma factor